MAKTSSYGFTNVTPSEHTLTPTALGMASNYAITEEDATNCVLTNITAPIDCEEVVTFRSRQIRFVANKLNIQNPAKVSTGVQYQAQIEAVRTTTDSADPNFRVDEPITALLTIRHPRSSSFTSEAVETIVTRLFSSLYKDDGTCRISDLMRGAERPIED